LGQPFKVSTCSGLIGRDLHAMRRLTDRKQSSGLIGRRADYFALDQPIDSL
jgi:hypothetical protein